MEKEAYKTHGISYLHEHNYFGGKETIEKYLKDNKLDHPKIRIGHEVIITTKNLSEVLKRTKMIR